jgi:hypothetical protein
MQKYTGSAEGGTPLRALVGATVIVTNSPSGTAATIYSDNAGTPKSNPFTTGSDGEFEFYAPNGRYNVTISATGYQNDVKSDVILYDAADVPPAGSATIAWGAITGGDPTVQSDLNALLNAKADAAGTATALASKADSATTTAALAGKVPTTRTVNGKALSTDISLTAADVSALASNSCINDLTTGGTSSPLSAEQGKTLRSKKLWVYGTTPTNSDGLAGDRAMRMDAGKKGVTYTHSGSAFIQDTDDQITLSSLPTASSSTLGDVYLVTDLGKAGVVVTTKTFDSGSTYAWAKLYGSEMVVHESLTVVDTSLAASETLVRSVTLPNHAGLYCVGMRIRFDFWTHFTTRVTSGNTLNQVIKRNSDSAVLLNQSLTAANTTLLTAHTRTELIFDDATGPFQLATGNVGSAGFIGAGGATLDQSFTIASLPGTQFDFKLTGVSGDAARTRITRVSLVYPD